MTVTATYEDDSESDVTSKATFTGYNMSTAGNQTVTVSYTEKGVTKTASYSIKVKVPSTKRYKLVTEQSKIAEGYKYLIVYDTHAFAGVSSSIGSKVDITVSEDNIISNPTGAHTVQFEAATGGNFYIKDGDDYLLGPDGNSLKTTTDKNEAGTKWTVSPDDIINVDYSERGLRYNTGSPRFCNYKSSNNVKDVVLYRQFDNVTITAAEYATFCGADALDLSGTGITAFTATDGETSVKLNEITSGKVPANTPVVLYKEGLSTKTTFEIPVAASADDPTGTNDLHVVGEDGLTGEDYIYVLAKPSDTVGFYLWDKTQTLEEGKIYLQGKASYGARSFLGFEEGNTTAIDVRSKMDDVRGEVYNLNGQRVAQPNKGLYIVNGKKVVIK